MKSIVIGSGFGGIAASLRLRAKKHENRVHKNVYRNFSTRLISQMWSDEKRNIKAVFHFGEFSRIAQSFKYFNTCFNSNLIGSNEVFKFSRDFFILFVERSTLCIKLFF